MPETPKGLHWRTYDRLSRWIVESEKAHRDVIAASIQGMMGWMGGAEGRQRPQKD